MARIRSVLTSVLLQPHIGISGLIYEYFRSDSVHEMSLVVVTCGDGGGDINVVNLFVGNGKRF